LNGVQSGFDNQEIGKDRESRGEKTPASAFSWLITAAVVILRSQREKSVEKRRPRLVTCKLLAQTRADNHAFELLPVEEKIDGIDVLKVSYMVNDRYRLGRHMELPCTQIDT
jgi:hypothetical protein